MLEFLSQLKTVFETFSKIKTAFEGLKSSNLLTKQQNLFDLVEKYFSLEPLPKGKIKLVGRLSNYTLNNNFPMYTPAHLKGIKQTQEQGKGQLELQVQALNIPAIAHNTVELSDKTKAKILWLYEDASEGLVFKTKEKQGLARNNLCEIFGIENKDKPIPILVDNDFSNQFLYKSVQIIGTLSTASIELFKQFSSETDTFILNYFSNCFRPFSNQDGILAIDARKPNGNVKILSENSKPFKIIYTIQGSIELPKDFTDNHNGDLIMNECIDSIPDRQGLAPIRSIGDQVNNTYSIVSIGDTVWQRDKTNSGIAAFKELDVNNYSYSQADLVELANNWQVWQRVARQNIRQKFDIEPKIRPLMCSNTFHEKQFHPNGLQISKTIEEKLLNANPSIRKSIDWLGISLGR